MSYEARHALRELLESLPDEALPDLRVEDSGKGYDIAWNGGHGFHIGGGKGMRFRDIGIDELLAHEAAFRLAMERTDG
jgi:hypothetical protein